MWRARLRLNAAAAKVNSEVGFGQIAPTTQYSLLQEDVSVVQRENELQQDRRGGLIRSLLMCCSKDLQIYLSDVFELGIDELNEASGCSLSGQAMQRGLPGACGSASQRCSAAGPAEQKEMASGSKQTLLARLGLEHSANCCYRWLILFHFILYIHIYIYIKPLF